MSTPHHSRMTIDMPFDEHRKLKSMAAFMGVSLKDLVLDCLRDNLLSENVPNEETLEAFKETNEGKGLVHCKDFNDFVQQLGLSHAQHIVPHSIQKRTQKARKTRKRH